MQNSGYNVEKKLLSKWNNLDDYPDLKNRYEKLCNRSGLKDNAFLPSTLHNEENLKLRKDFAFWKEGYDPELDHSVAVLLTAALILQRAREFNKFKDDDHRLASDTFQQVVLDPDNFSRYNDGVIQAALLRTAHPSELDYSSCEDFSRRMTDILLGMLRSHLRQQGEAVLEFAFALYNGRLRLIDSDVDRLKEETRNMCDDNGKYVKLLKHIFDKDSSEAWNEPSI